MPHSSLCPGAVSEPGPGEEGESVASISRSAGAVRPGQAAGTAVSSVTTRASNEGYPKVREDFTIMVSIVSNDCLSNMIIASASEFTPSL